ncbi:MAG TPA: glycosyltransferase family 2 protein [Anaerolineales bacterium]|nr:glycosyltransferase family 2 protein [Anaerolineales bacterium]
MNPANMNNLPAKYPKMTIITPSLNQGQFIDATIRSVISQEYPNLEYIIMDGGSSDNTLAILHSYSDRVKWVSEKDEGQTNAINKGLYMASGEVLAYLNADDLLLPGTLIKVAQKFMENPGAVWITGKCRIINENDREVRGLITAYKNLYLCMHHRSLLLITDYISQPATFWRADVFRDLGPLDESLHYAMDYEYWLRLNAKFPLVIIPEYLAAFRVHSQSKNTNVGHRNIYIDEERVVVHRYTKSRFLQVLHDLHRWFMTTIYSIINKD